MKDTFIIKTKYKGIINKLSDKQAGALLKMIFEYVESGANAGSNDDKIDMAFDFIRIDLDDYHRKNRLYLHSIRNSAASRNWRNEVFKRDNYTCQNCKKVGDVLNAHHVKPFSIYPELRFELSNGLTLCKRCHIDYHKKEREWVRTAL